MLTTIILDLLKYAMLYRLGHKTVSISVQSKWFVHRKTVANYKLLALFSLCLRYHLVVAIPEVQIGRHGFTILLTSGAHRWVGRWPFRI